MRNSASLLLVVCLILTSCSDKIKEEKNDSHPEKTYPIAVITTNFGSMFFWLFDETPNHKAKFIELADKHHYDQFTMNRVVKNFVIQGGCPDSVQYFEGSPYLLEPEFNDSIKHVYGALGMGRDDNPEKKSNACQFYVVSYEAGLPSLDSKYMIFGKIVKGADVLETIEHVQVDKNDKPLEDISLHVFIENMTEKQMKDSLNFEL
ncbi:MAG: peptidylprolyl isomerase [Bacteroidetes bacterium]|nr:peptidylprolyl isomerase [Bacteroidota bacterium]